MKLKQSEVVPRFMTIRKPSKPITVHSAIEMAHFFLSHPILGRNIHNCKKPTGQHAALLLILDGICAGTEVRRGRSSFTQRKVL